MKKKIENTLVVGSFLLLFAGFFFLLGNSSSYSLYNAIFFLSLT